MNSFGVSKASICLWQGFQGLPGLHCPLCLQSRVLESWPGCCCWCQDGGLGQISFPAGNRGDPSQEASGTTAPTPSANANQQAQMSSYLSYIYCFSTIIFYAKTSWSHSCSCPSSLVQQYLILQFVLKSFGLIQVKFFCTCDLLRP